MQSGSARMPALRLNLPELPARTRAFEACHAGGSSPLQNAMPCITLLCAAYLSALMTRTFKHKGLARFFTKGDHRAIPARSAARIERMLDRLDSSTAAGDVDLPGYRFHPLKGSRAGELAVSVSGNWRITFRFDGEDAIDVDLEDCH